MNNILNLIGRILISSVFLISGFNKINQYNGTIEWMEELWYAWYSNNTSYPT